MKIKGQKGSILISAGSLLIAAALCLGGYNLWDGMRADRSVSAVTQQLTAKQIVKQTVKQAETPAAVAQPLIHELNPQMEMPVETVEEWDYIGTVAFPQRGIELAVISEWSYPALKAAPCRYSGSAYTDDLILSAHNYAAHFGCLKNLFAGEWITFTDMEGNVFTYEVVETEILAPTDVDRMGEGEWDLTLFTCTVGGQSRVTVRCERVDGIYT